MNYDIITAKSNPAAKLISALQSSSKERKKHNQFVLEGLRLCDDAYLNGIKFNMLVLTQGMLEKHSENIKKYIESASRVYIFSEELFFKISDTKSPQGIIAVADYPKEKKFTDRFGKYIALENIQDPSNLGAIARTAEALGASGMIVCGGCDPFSPKVLRSSMGTVLRLPLFLTDDVTEFIKNHGLRAFAAVPDETAEPINGICFKGGDAVLVGNEANGLSENAIKFAYKKITVPMKGRAESLNAAAAAAIALWELVK